MPNKPKKVSEPYPVDASVTVKFMLRDLCHSNDIDAYGSLDKLVRYLIREEGLFGIVSGKGRILKVSAVTPITKGRQA